jgi:hypothetical protein
VRSPVGPPARRAALPRGQAAFRQTISPAMAQIRSAAPLNAAPKGPANALATPGPRRGRGKQRSQSGIQIGQPGQSRCRDRHPTPLGPPAGARPAFAAQPPHPVTAVPRIPGWPASSARRRLASTRQPRAGLNYSPVRRGGQDLHSCGPHPFRMSRVRKWARSTGRMPNGHRLTTTVAGLAALIAGGERRGR